jgi:hypothetical protein
MAAEGQHDAAKRHRNAGPLQGLEALVSRMPTPTSRYSSANRQPTTTPGQKVPSRSDMRSPRHSMSAPTSRAAMPDRSATCISGDMSGAVAFMATCCRPHNMHSSSIRPMARASIGWREVDMA